MENKTNLSLEFWRSLAYQGSVVYQTVFWCIVLRLQCPEQRLFGTQNLHRTRGVLGQAEQTARVTDQPGTDEVSDQGGQIWRDCGHSISKVLGKLRTVGGDGDDLITEGVDVVDIGVGYLGTHRYFGSGFDGGFKLFGKNCGKICRGSVRPETHDLDDLGVRQVVDDDFCELREMPAVPFL